MLSNRKRRGTEGTFSYSHEPETRHSAAVYPELGEQSCMYVPGAALHHIRVRCGRHQSHARVAVPDRGSQACQLDGRPQESGNIACACVARASPWTPHEARGQEHIVAPYSGQA